MVSFSFSALKKSQKEANSLVQKSSKGKDTNIHRQENPNKSSHLETDLTGQWRSLFLHMEDTFVRESSQLVSVTSVSFDFDSVFYYMGFSFYLICMLLGCILKICMPASLSVFYVIIHNDLLLPEQHVKNYNKSKCSF